MRSKYEYDTYNEDKFALSCEKYIPCKLGGYHVHDDVIKWKHFPRYWPFVRPIHRSLVNSFIKASDAEL